jgi:hypothetical protein
MQSSPAGTVEGTGFDDLGTARGAVALTGGAARVIGSRMRRRAALLIAVACAACGGRGADVYPPDVVQNFMSACTAGSDERVCRCALDALERRFTVEQFLGFEARMRGGEMPKEMIDAVAGCGR